MVKENRVVGGIVAYRPEVRAFSQKQIDLVSTFADQAVIAIENVRLFKELQARNAEISEALEQQTATAEILKVISSSPTDTQPVFDAIVESGSRLFGGVRVGINLQDGGKFRRVASTSSLNEGALGDAVYVRSVDDDSMPGPRAMMRREDVDVPDFHEGKPTREGASADRRQARNYSCSTAIEKRRGWNHHCVARKSRSVAQQANRLT
jgi:hypothetical protein